ncbi:DUF6773 family protein [Proteinivorax hydrogeniformans]|uniref:DUF6773 family protein n=1 Tax=Proteinivorax hydrogeniformans TaxID=1826727 RepID=A0AAU8HUI7_9FIRM
MFKKVKDERVEQQVDKVVNQVMMIFLFGLLLDNFYRLIVLEVPFNEVAITFFTWLIGSLYFVIRLVYMGILQPIVSYKKDFQKIKKAAFLQGLLASTLFGLLYAIFIENDFNLKIIFLTLFFFLGTVAVNLAMVKLSYKRQNKDSDYQ